jgi:hypothetical protein
MLRFILSRPLAFDFPSIHTHAHAPLVSLDHHRLVAHAPDHVERLGGLAPQRQLLHVRVDPALDRLAHFLLDSEVPIRRRAPVKALVGPPVVVILHPVGEPIPCLLERVESGAAEELLLQRLPEPLDLPERHGVVRRTADVMHVVAAKLRLELGDAPPVGVLPAVIGEHLLRWAVLPDRLAIHLQHVVGRLAAVEPERHDVAGVVVDEPDDKGISVKDRVDRDVALPHPVWRGALEAPLDGLGRLSRLGRGRKNDLRSLQFPPHASRARIEQEAAPQQVRDPPHAPRGLFALERNNLLAHRDGQLRPSRASLPVHQPRRPPLPVLLHPVVQRLLVYPQFLRHQRSGDPILHIQPYRLQPELRTVRLLPRLAVLPRQPLLLFRLHEFHSRPTAVPPGKCHPLLRKSHAHYLVANAESRKYFVSLRSRGKMKSLSPGGSLNVTQFIAKWSRAELKERSAAQEHFLDLCRVVGHKTPAEADPTGEFFCFERGAEKHGPSTSPGLGGNGFADVWKKGFFGWEYKGKHKDLEKALDQLLLYKDALENPPLLVVCDMDLILVRTNFTGTAPVTHEIPLAKMGEPRSVEILQAVFFAPEKLKPGRTSAAITQDAAKQFASVADSMRERGLDPAQVAHFLDRVVFCQFAEDIGLLPDMIFSRIVEKSGGEPVKFCRFIGQLFEAMAKGGEFGLESIRHFNGSLFDDNTVPELNVAEVRTISQAASLDWSAVDPSIFGTLFERGLDPAKRSQLGAHFTGKADIELLVDAVVMTPLNRDWLETKSIVENLLATGRKNEGAGDGVQAAGKMTDAKLRKVRGEASSLIHQFLTRLANVKVLDPACGSGNFLYVTLQKLKDLEKAAIVFSLERELGGYLPLVGPWQLYGIEVNPYAHDLAQMTVWIGWLQWIKFNGFGSPAEPILRSMTANFRCMDAILDLADPANPKEPEWPKVDFIVGNPPFLGGNRVRQELGDAYVETLFKLYKDRVPAFADLCCYWFEKARAQIEKLGCKRGGLLATQGIRGGANREVLKRIKDTGEIFWAVSDKDWVLDGANVHVSMIAFDNKDESERMLDGHAVETINPDLTACANITTAQALFENKNICFMGPSPKAPFDIDAMTALRLLQTTGNPNGRDNADVVRPVVSAIDLTRQSRQMWTIDFGFMLLEEAAQYQAPFEYVKENVYPIRSQNKRASYAEKWWQYAELRPGMRVALKGQKRFIVTPAVSKHRVFVWVNAEILANQGTLVFAREDDYFFGVLHSRIHELWALEQGTALEDRPRYTPTTSFETFPMPWSPGKEPKDDERYQAIEQASRELVQKRDAWLSGQDPADKKARTLTRLYNEHPTWLELVHRKLDEAVFAAYGWDTSLSDDHLLEKLLALNAERSLEELVRNKSLQKLRGFKGRVALDVELDSLRKRS